MRALQVAIVPVTPFQQNASLAWCTKTKTGTVVDPGGDVAKLIAAAGEISKEHGVTFSRIWLTHGHIDHAGGAAELAEKLGGADIIGPDQRDAFLLDRLPQAGLQFGMAGVRAVTPTRWLTEGDVLELGDVRFSVLHCPGHTPGSVVLFSDAERFAFMGDVLFQNSIGRTDFEYGDHDALIMAIKTKLMPLGDDVTFLPGHGGASTIGHERQNNPYIR